MCDKKRTPDETQKAEKARPSIEPDGSVTIQIDSEPTEEKTETPSEENVLFALSKQNDQLERALEEANAEREELRAKAERYEAAEEEASQLRGEHERMLRSMAHYQEQTKRAEKAWEEALNFGSADLLKELTPVRDDLARALKAAETEDMRTGLEGIIKKMDAAFERAGLEPIEPTKGEPMDPNAHQAAGVAPFPMEGFNKGDVIEVQQRGYLLRGRILRYADVIVAGADADEKTEIAPESGLPEESAENSNQEGAEETAEASEDNSTEEGAEETADNETEA